MAVRASKLASLFTAAALTAGAAFMPTPAAAFTVGHQSGGDGAFSFIELEDNNGREYRLKLPSAANDPRFKDIALEVMRDYVSWKDFSQMNGHAAAGFTMVVKLLAEYSGTYEFSFVDSIGLDRQLYDELMQKERRFVGTALYRYIRDAASSSDPWFANQDLEYNEQSVQEANEQIARSASRYPDDPAFRLPPLNTNDLIVIREKAAFANVNYLLDLFRQIDSGALNARMLNHKHASRLEQIADLLYRDIQKDPSQARHDDDIVAGNDFNRRIPALMDDELMRRGVDRDQFYKRFVELRNYYVRTNVIEAVPPSVPAPRQP